MYKLIMISCVLVMVMGWPQMFATNTFKVGIEYQNSLPMGGGSERYRHRNNLDPFYVTVTASAKNGYVITYLEVETTTDITGEVEFDLVQGQTGSKTMVFQLISNQTDFLKYNYLVYGIREEEYKKLHNIITIQMRNSSAQLLFHNCFMIIVLTAIKIRSLIEKECLHDEVHKSCAFYEEYTCWETEAMDRRVKASPKRLAHCRAGCYCKKGLVRTYPQGKCIIAQACRDLELRGVLEKIPAEFSNVR